MATDTADLSKAQIWRKAHGKVQDAELISFIRAYASEHYNDRFGWSEVVEAWTDADIIKEIGYADTEKGALKKVKEIVDIRSDHFDDIAGTAF